MSNTFQPRIPMLALMMSLVLPGFGQLYNGEPNKAIWLFLGYAFLTVPAMALVALYLPDAWMISALLTSLVLALLTWCYGMVDAWRNARRKQDFQLRRWQISGMYMLVLLFFGAALALLIVEVRAHQVAPYRVPSSSMLPNIMPGDHFFADMRYNCLGCKQGVKRGDVAIFSYPNDRTVVYIKRIIGLPGDRIHIQGDEISVNGHSLKRQSTPTAAGILVTEAEDGKQWDAIWQAPRGGTLEFDLTVPAGQVFVLGDNRSNSVDSRTFGTVALQDVVGKARQVWFSWGDSGVRWDRLGKVLN